MFKAFEDFKNQKPEWLHLVCSLYLYIYIFASTSIDVHIACTWD